MAKCHSDWRVISVRYFNPAGNHHSGLIGDNPMGTIPGNLFSVIQEVIIGKRELVTVFGSDYNTFDGSGVRDFVHVTDLGKISFIQQRDILKLWSTWPKWIITTIMIFSTLAQAMDLASFKSSKCSRKSFIRRSTINSEIVDLEIWKGLSQLQSRQKLSSVGKPKKLSETCVKVV